MSQDYNNLQRHIEDCLAARREMRDELDEGDPWDDWDWGDEMWGASELDEQNDWQQHEEESNDWRVLQHDWEEHREPRDLEYGGCYYPADHVREARELRDD